MKPRKVRSGPPRAAKLPRRLRIRYLPPDEAAKAAALRYVTDAGPGIRRRRSGPGFSYRDAEGALIRDRAVLARVKSLAIPPAWTDVWICPLPNGHVQATGRDARGRKQYRYHPRWRAVRDEAKYERLARFGATLPRLRERVEADLHRPGLPREKVLAIVVRLLETTFMRVGNEEYVKANGSFGLTTLRNHHAEVDGSTIYFRFRGKSGKQHEIAVNDRRLAKLVRRCRELPGQDLFQFVDEVGEPQPIASGDVNEYLRGVTGEDFTAKDFRTWAGTLLAARHLPRSDSHNENEVGKAAMLATIQDVAKKLGNTPAVCRKCYIHPAVLNAFIESPLLESWTSECVPAPGEAGLSDEESALLRYLAIAGA